MAPRQTFSYLQHQFAAAGLQPQTRFGQNFLIDLNLVELIAKTAELTPQDVVLEVGTGMGSLTTIMAAQAGHVLTVEIDHFLAPLAQREFERFDNITLMQQDALKSKNQLHPQVVERGGLHDSSMKHTFLMASLAVIALQFLLVWFRARIGFIEQKRRLA